MNQLCGICNENPSIGVFASGWGPMSDAVCQPCFDLKAVPFHFILIEVALRGEENLTDYEKASVEGTLKRFNKTREEFDRLLAAIDRKKLAAWVAEQEALISEALRNPKREPHE